MDRRRPAGADPGGIVERTPRSGPGRAASVAIAVALPAALALAVGAFVVGPRSAALPGGADPACPTPATDDLPCVTLDLGAADASVFFRPNLITIPADTPVRFVFVNRESGRHNFSITDHRNPGLANLNVSVDVAADSTAETTIQAPTGTHFFYCDEPFHEDLGMYGYLTVGRGAAVGTGVATVSPPAQG